MNIYDAIMKAADSIERNPNLFGFEHVGVPNECGTPGCAIGWIGMHLGLSGSNDLWFSDKSPLCAMGFKGIPFEAQDAFYARMEKLAPGWRDDPMECANALRLYAEKYHADDKPKHLPVKAGIPQSVLDIFKAEDRATA